ncbi:MAG: GGDEF domain-containing protein [Stellaceae bacterium]
MTSNTRLFLSRELASRREFWFALVAVLVSVVIFLAVAPIATRPLARIPAFIPAYESALIVCDLITGVMLFAQFNNLRSRALLVLACGYLFTAFIAFVHMLTFPDAFSATGLLGAGPPTTGWLYIFWHGGFPLFVILYALLKNDESTAAEIGPASGLPRGRADISILAGIGAVLAIVFGLTLVATAYQDTLPVFIVNNRFTPGFTVVVSGVWMLSFLALALLAWRRRYTVLDLWLMVVMCAWICSIALAAVLNAGRYDAGWYGGRIYGLAAASMLLIVLLIESAKYYARLTQLSVEVSAANVILEGLSVQDGLTKLANRRLFDTYLANQIAIARRFARPLALVLFDVDAFKGYNDHYGHQAGDECLKQVAAALQSCSRRPADLAARYGGEEFALILPDTDLTGASHIAEEARETVAQLKILHKRSATELHVSISGGVAVLLQQTGMNAEELISAADLCLFQAKHLGRNRVVSAQPEPAASPPSAIPLRAPKALTVLS